ncbi:MAG: alpha/beta fold hydrolase [Phycisphaerales bacterium]|nr:alpha/beta fold hydrolase [Phycisphaerales bacterium]
MGLALLFLLGTLAAAVIHLLGIVRDARHPARASPGWALARKIPIDPAAMGLACTEEHWGQKQTAWCLRGACHDSGIITIIVHGWRRSRIDSLRRVHPWIDESEAVWLLDLAGHGDSPVGPTTLGSADVIDLVHLTHEIIARANISPGRSPRIVIVGHSLGASIALRAAAQLSPDDIAGVVAFAPYESLSEPLTNRLEARGLPAVPFALVAQWILHRICGAETSTTAAMAQLQTKGVPLLIIASQQDAVVSLQHIATICRTASVQFTVDPDTTHDDLGTRLNESPKSATTLAVERFLRGHLQRPDLLHEGRLN